MPIDDFETDLSRLVGGNAAVVVTRAIPQLREIALRYGWSQNEANEVARFIGTLAVDVGVAVGQAVADYIRGQRGG